MAAIAVPATLASLAYLNAKLGIQNDWPMVSSLVTSLLAANKLEKQDRINIFYDLEGWATDKKDADRTFLLFDGKRWSYKEAYLSVLRYARWLKEELQVAKGEIVAIAFVNGDTQIWLMFALWSLGAIPALLNYNTTGKPLIHTLRTSTSRLFLVDPEVIGTVTDEVKQAISAVDFLQDGNGGMEMIVVDQITQDRILADPSGWRAPDESRAGAKIPDMCMLIYTSGTTGLPKPAIVSWGKAAMGARFTRGMIGVKKSDVVYTAMPIYHTSASVLAMVLVLKAGCTLALGKRFSVRTFWQEVRESKATRVQYVGETLRYLLSAPPSPLDSQHNVRLVYGNGLRPDVWPVFKERFAIPMIAEFYGATEGPGIMFNLSANTFSQGAIGRTGSLARLMFGGKSNIVKYDFEQDMQVRDPRTGLCVLAEVNEPGELIYMVDENDIKRTFQGYFGNQNATTKKILRDVKKSGDAAFSTGDIVRVDAEGRAWFVDRIGDTFRWRSENVSTAEVGEVVGSTPGVAEANAYGVLVPKHDGRAGCAAIVLKGASESATAGKLPLEIPPPSEAVLTAIASNAKQNLPKYAVPLFLRFTRQMELTGTNKQQKHVFREQGIDVEKVSAAGDRLYWLQDGRYVLFERKDLDRIASGGAKL